MKVQVINTDFLHDGTYYYQKSIIDMPPDIVKKYPRNLIPLEEIPIVIEPPFVSEMVQDNSSTNNMLVPTGFIPSGLVPLGIVNQSRLVGTKKNKRGR